MYFAVTVHECGSRPIIQPMVRIVGGYKAMPGAYPWQASIQKFQFGVQWGHWCGATIVNEYWVISAAHCYRYDYQSLRETSFTNGDWCVVSL